MDRDTVQISMALYLITGGAGFIGSHLADALIAEGHRVRVLDDLSTGRRANLDSRVELIVGDASDAEIYARAAEDAEAIFHLCAITSVELCERDRKRSRRVNLTAATHAFALAHSRRIPVVYASSAAVYGNRNDRALAEDDELKPVSAYGIDKLETEKRARAVGVSSVGLRFFNVYGPRQRPGDPYSGVVTNFCEKVRRGEPCVVFGDGAQTRDFVYVGDVVAALRLSLSLATADAPIFNVGSGAPTAIRELAVRLSAIGASAAAPISGPARANDIRHSLADIRRLRSRGWSPRTALDEGLKATYENSRRT
jgi:UDP-glucose 4-epimerase